MRTKIFMSCRSRSYEVAMNRFQKDLDLILEVMSGAADIDVDELVRAKTFKKAKETFNYPDWMEDLKKPDIPKAWRARPGFMRGIEVSREKAEAYKGGSVPATGVSSTEKVVTLKNGRQIFGKVTTEGDNYTIETNKGSIKIPKSKVLSVEGKKVLDHLTGKDRNTLSKIVLPLEHGWTEKEILYAMWGTIFNNAKKFAAHKGKWDKSLTWDDAIQTAGLALLDAIRTDVGGTAFTVHAGTHMGKYLARRAQKERKIKKKEGISYDQPVLGAEGEEKNPFIQLLADKSDAPETLLNNIDEVSAILEKTELSPLERDVAIRMLGIGTDSGERWTPLDRVVLKPHIPGAKIEVIEGRHIRTGGAASKPTVTLKMADGKEKTIVVSDIESINPQLPSSASPLIRIVTQDGREITGRKLGVETKTVRDASGKAVGEKKVLSVRTTDGKIEYVSRDEIQKHPDGSLAITEPPSETRGQWHNPEAHRRVVGFSSEPKPMREIEIAKELGVDESTIQSAKKGALKKFEETRKALEKKLPTESVEPKVSLNEWKRQMGLRIL